MAFEMLSIRKGPGKMKNLGLSPYFPFTNP